MPLQATSGAASYDAFGGGVPVVPNYIEDVFSTYLYTGTGSAQTITNGIDLTGKGGMVWSKSRDRTGIPGIIDTVRGNRSSIYPSLTGAQDTAPNDTYAITGFNSTGYGLGLNYSFNINDISFGITNYVSWTFRKQPKFFDVVTFTTDGTGAATVSHALGSTPAFVIVKRTDSTGLWLCWHTSLPSTNYYLFLNLTNAQTNSGGTWLTPSSTQVSFPSNSSTGALDSSANYVMYVYASNAGGFGLTGTDNVISCGSYYNSGSAPVNVTLGYEPQWILIKKTDSAQDWFLMDTMRGDSLTAQNLLRPNTSNAETVNAGAPGYPAPTATGFTSFLGAEGTFIYIAIRRGPMKVPTDATKVFKPVFQNGYGTVTTNFPVSLVVAQKPDGAGANWQDRLRGGSTNSYNVLYSYNTNAEASGTGAGYGFDNNNGYVDAFNSSAPRAYWNFQRAPSFFDEVCFTSDSGGGTGADLPHNLTVQPNLMIFKARGSSSNWIVTCTEFASWQYFKMYLNLTTAKTLDGSGVANSSASTFAVFNNGQLPANSTCVAYLFATCVGVSKVFSFTGTGSLQTINCGFTSGARFVLVKRTDSTGDWYVWDSARGISSSTDPYLLLNSTAAEVTSTNWVDTTSTGFQVTAASGNNVNINGATYIGLAIA